MYIYDSNRKMVAEWPGQKTIFGPKSGSPVNMLYMRS
jgi:hypothetical protein